MSQICYNIFMELQKRDNHIRGIAKSLNINQMTVARKVKELAKQNILDYREEGRNNVYFVKNSLESKEYIMIVEHHKLLKSISKHAWLRQIIEYIMENDNISLVILFGSYAKNTADKKSDIDIYIETNDKTIIKNLELLDSRLSVKSGSFDMTAPLTKEIISNHVILKGVDRYYELIHKKT